MEQVEVSVERAASSQRPVLPSLDFARLRADEPPAQAHQKQQLQQQTEHERRDERSAARASRITKPAAAKAQRLRLARLSRLDGCTKAKVSRSVQTAHVKSWLHAHGYVVKADKLHPAVTRVIAEWFRLVDADNSRTLEHHELAAALKAAKIPCDDATIHEMISMMDMNRDGVIGWDEFEVFMTEEFAAGKSLLSGEYLLPSGLSLNFGVMIGKLKRNRLLGDVMEDKRRNKWADIARNPEALGRELATMQEAAEAANPANERSKRAEQGDKRAATPRKQLTTGLLRAMEHSRKLARSMKQRDTARGLAYESQDGSAQPLASPVPPSEPASAVAAADFRTGGPPVEPSWDLSSVRGALLPSSRAASPGPASQSGMTAPPPAGLATRLPERGGTHGSAAAGSAAFAAASMIKAQEPPPPPPAAAAAAAGAGSRHASGGSAETSPIAAAGAAHGAEHRLFGAAGAQGRSSPASGRQVRVAAGEALAPSPHAHAHTNAMAHTASSLLHRRRVARTMSCVAELAEEIRGGGAAGARSSAAAAAPSPPPPPPLASELSLPALPGPGSGAGSPAASPRGSAMPLHQHYLRAPGLPQTLQLRRASHVSLHSEGSASTLGSPVSAPLATLGSLPHPLPNVGAARLSSGSAAPATAAAPAAPSQPSLSAPLPPLAAPSFAAAAGAAAAAIAAAPAAAAAAGPPAQQFAVQLLGTPRVYSSRMLPILPDHTQLAAFMDSTIAVARAEAGGSPGPGGSNRTVEGFVPAPHRAHNSVMGPARASAPGLHGTLGAPSAPTRAPAGSSAARHAQPPYCASADCGLGSFASPPVQPAHHGPAEHAYAYGSIPPPPPSPPHSRSASPGPAPGSGVGPLPRDPVALLTERKAVVRASLNGMASAGAPRPAAAERPALLEQTPPGAPRRAASPAIDPDASEWISYTRVPATAVGPTPLAAASVHAHYGSRAGAPLPPPIPGAGAHTAGLGSVTELGATAAVIALAQAQATAQAAEARPASSLGMLPPHAGPGAHATAHHPSGAERGSSPAGAMWSGRGGGGGGRGSPIPTGQGMLGTGLYAAAPSPHPLHQPEQMRQGRPPEPQRHLGDPHAYGGGADGGGGGDCDGGGDAGSHALAVLEADDEVARLLNGGGGWSAWLERNRPDPQTGPEVMLRGPRGESLDQLEEKWARAPLPEALMQELSAHNVRLATEVPGGGGGGGGVGGGYLQVHDAAAAAALLGRWHGPSTSGAGAAPAALQRHTGSGSGPPAAARSAGLGAESSHTSASGPGAHHPLRSAWPCADGQLGGNSTQAAGPSAHPEGRSQGTGCGGVGGAAVGSGSRPASRLGGPSRGASPMMWQDCRPPTRSRTQLVMRNEKEDPNQLSWRAAAASLLQLRLAKQLYDLDARRI